MENGKLAEISPEELEAVKAIEAAVETLMRHSWNIFDYDFVQSHETRCGTWGKSERTRHNLSLRIERYQPPREA